jgi:hypothetical protein
MYQRKLVQKFLYTRDLLYYITNAIGPQAQKTCGPILFNQVP